MKKKLSNALFLFSIIILMFGLSYAAVPIYRLFCQTTGFLGTTQVATGNEISDVTGTSRIMTIKFNADVADNLPWKFTPAQTEIKLVVGETALAFYTAENTTDNAITGISTYNVTPPQAGPYFNKIQCFCFEHQRLNPQEIIDMPVFFFIDPDILNDKKMSKVDTITLSYTFFKVDK